MVNRLHEWYRTLYDRLIFVPVVFVVIGLVTGLASVRLDNRLSDDWMPVMLRTTVTSADSILSTIAGGLIAAITLLLSLTLVAVQLASGRFSPRTISNWIGDKTQQMTIGLVLGTTVYCLMVLRETRSFEDGSDVSPDLSVLMAVTLMVVCLVAVARSVGHLSNRMQVGTVARTLMQDTVKAVRDYGSEGRTLPVNRQFPPGTALPKQPEGDWTPAVSRRDGWVQNLDYSRLANLAEEGSVISVTAPVGSFVLAGEPVAWIERPAPRGDRDRHGRDHEQRHGGVDGDDEHDLEHDDEIDLADEIAVIVPERRVERNPAYGIMQMSDVALRALSPGINDPNTARDLIAYLGVVLVAAWEQPPAPTEFDAEGRTIRTEQMTHGQYLDAALAQIVRYGAHDVDVMEAILNTLATLEATIVRRSLPGPVEPVDEFRNYVADVIRAGDLLPRDRNRLLERATAA